MRKILLMALAAMMVSISAQAQRLHVVDDDGNGIPLVSVLTENGVLIGTTDLHGVLADVKGVAKVALTHVAYKPQLVTVSDLPSFEGTEGGRRVTMESIDYGLDEVVVMPKPYFYVEYYYRAFSYIEDSLRAYSAGIIPVKHEIQDNYKGNTRTIWSYGGAANKALSWNVDNLERRAEQGAKKAIPSVWEARESERFKDYYKASFEPDGNSRLLIRNPQELIGQIVYSDGFSHTTIDGAKAQIYANKANGEDRMARRREEKNYAYQFTEVYKLDEEGKVQNEGFVMNLHHWEHDTKNGKMITILYLYATDKGYVNNDEFKTRSKELNKNYAGNMSLDELAEYERDHNIPALAPEQQIAIQGLAKQTK